MRDVRKQVSWLALGLVLWLAVYVTLAPLADWLTYRLLFLQRGQHLGRSVEFFVFETPKVLTLRLLLTFFGVVAFGILIVGYLFNAVM